MELKKIHNLTLLNLSDQHRETIGRLGRIDFRKLLSPGLQEIFDCVGGGTIRKGEEEYIRKRRHL
jgi:hypothetical protein